MKELSKIQECLEKGLLKKALKSKKLALQDLKQAEFFLNEAYDLIVLKKKEMALIALYNAVFHSGRALLYNEGFREKSHYCLQKFLEESFVSKGMLSGNDTGLFDALRELRQEVQYDTVRVEITQDLNELFDSSEQFIQKSKRIIEG